MQRKTDISNEAQNYLNLGLNCKVAQPGESLKLNDITEKEVVSRLRESAQNLLDADGRKTDVIGADHRYGRLVTFVSPDSTHFFVADNSKGDVMLGISFAERVHYMHKAEGVFGTLLLDKEGNVEYRRDANQPGAMRGLSQQEYLNEFALRIEENAAYSTKRGRAGSFIKRLFNGSIARLN